MMEILFTELELKWKESISALMKKPDADGLTVYSGPECILLLR